MSGWASLRSEQARENSRRASREAKRRRRGVCVDCGAETRYAGHSKGESPRCRICGPKYHAREHLRGRGHVVESLRGFLATGPKRFSEIRDHLGVTSQHATMRLRRSMAYGEVVRISRGVYALADHNTGMKSE